MNSVFSAFKSNKGSPTTLNSSSSDSKRSASSNKKTLNLNETNNYGRLRHIREKMSNLMIDDDEINLRKPPCSIPIAPIDLTLVDECDSMLPPVKPKSSKVNGFDCIDSAAPMHAIVNGNHKSYASSSLSAIKKHYNQDNSENYASENNLLSKCCNGGGGAGNATEMGSDVSIADVNDDDVNSASASSLISIKSMPLSNSNEASRSALTIYNKQPQSNRNRPRLSLSNVNCNGSSSTSTAASQPAVHGRNSSNGLPTGQTRTRLSTHQRNLSLDFR